MRLFSSGERRKEKFWLLHFLLSCFLTLAFPSARGRQRAARPSEAWVRPIHTQAFLFSVLIPDFLWVGLAFPWRAEMKGAETQVVSRQEGHMGRFAWRALA